MKKKKKRLWKLIKKILLVLAVFSLAGFLVWANNMQDVQKQYNTVTPRYGLLIVEVIKGTSAEGSVANYWQEHKMAYIICIALLLITFWLGSYDYIMGDIVISLYGAFFILFIITSNIIELPTEKNLIPPWNVNEVIAEQTIETTCTQIEKVTTTHIKGDEVITIWIETEID